MRAREKFVDSELEQSPHQGSIPQGARHLAAEHLNPPPATPPLQRYNGAQHVGVAFPQLRPPLFSLSIPPRIPLDFSFAFLAFPLSMLYPASRYPLSLLLWLLRCQRLSLTYPRFPLTTLCIPLSAVVASRHHPARSALSPFAISSRVAVASGNHSQASNLAPALLSSSNRPLAVSPRGTAGPVSGGGGW